MPDHDLLVQRHPFWRFEVMDNGCGFNPDDVPPDSLHVGLGIMKERAQRIGASLQVGARASGTGSSVTVTLPQTLSQAASRKDAVLSPISDLAA